MEDQARETPKSETMEGVDEMAVPPQELPQRLDDPWEEEEEERDFAPAVPRDVQMPPPHGCYFDDRRISAVPPQLVTKNKDSYVPRMVSFGPYKHGLPKHVVAEKFKLQVVDMFVSQTGKRREERFGNVFQVIGQIRNCYDGITEDVFDDAELAEIMLRDTIFLIYLMRIAVRDYELIEFLSEFLIENGLGVQEAISFLYIDMLLLDNQIPLSIINLFISLIHHNKEAEEKEDASSFVLSYIRLLMGDNTIKSFPAKDRKHPLHLLDAYWRLVTAEEHSNVQVHQPDAVYRVIRPFRSVSALKAMGIHFKPIDSLCVRKVKFDSWIFFGQLQLPILFVDDTMVVYSNLIAYEMSLGSTSKHVITSYINFMKSLIINPKDVNELREKGILFSNDSDEHVVKQFNEIETLGRDNQEIFCAVKNKIEDHRKRKAGIWMAELIYTYFRSPWTCIALLAATFLLCLATIQTYYTVNPAS